MLFLNICGVTMQAWPPCHVIFERRFYPHENKFLKNKTCNVTNMNHLTYFEVNSKSKPVLPFLKWYLITARFSANVESILLRIYAMYKWQNLVQRIVRFLKLLFHIIGQRLIYPCIFRFLVWLNYFGIFKQKSY